MINTEKTKLQFGVLQLTINVRLRLTSEIIRNNEVFMHIIGRFI